MTEPVPEKVFPVDQTFFEPLIGFGRRLGHVEATGARVSLQQILLERSRMAGLASGLFSELGAAAHVERMAREERA